MPRPLPRAPGRPATRARLAAALTAAALLILAPSPASAAVTAAAAVTDPAAPTAEELAAQRAEAQRLDGETRSQEQAIAEARARLAETAEQAGAAMQRYQEALRTTDEADAERDLQEQRLAVAEEVLAGNRTDLGKWASNAYREGGALARYEGLMTLLESESTDDLTQRLAMLRTVGRVRGSAVDVAADAEAVQKDATLRSRAAAHAAAVAAQAAATAKAEAEALLEAQRTHLATLDTLLAQTRDDADAAAGRAAQMALVRAASEQRRLAALAQAGRAGPNAVTGPVGECTGGDVHRYGNGSIPLSVLCPLASAPAHHLRADAAHAFDQLAQAYRAAFGESLCITDSYRSVGSRVRLFAAKPDLAAVPGTSNHGWGTAVDLCGGIESFDTVQHEWMRNNASLYGWFHPNWAQTGGSRPEPWHWEYGG